MKLILFFLTACIAAPVLVAAGSKSPSVFEIRLVVDEAAPDTVEMVIQNPMVPESREVVNVQKVPLMDLSSIASATVENVPNAIPNAERWEHHVLITFTDSVRETLATVTRQNLGKRVVFVLDGTIVLAPVIRAEIREGKVMVWGGFSEEQAAALAKKINTAFKSQ